MACPQCNGKKGRYINISAQNEKGEAILGQKQWEPCIVCSEVDELLEAVRRHTTTRGAFGPYCAKTDSVRCTKCGKVQTVEQMIAVNGTTYAKPRGGVWQVVYYYCQCNSIGVRVYDEGRGVLQVIEGNAELVLEDIETGKIPNFIDEGPQPDF